MGGAVGSILGSIMVDCYYDGFDKEKIAKGIGFQAGI